MNKQETVATGAEQTLTGQSPTEQTPAVGETISVVVDLGTTSIIVRGLLEGDRPTKTLVRENPGRVYGADVISRISASAEGFLEAQTADLIQTIEDMIREVTGVSGKDPLRLGRVIVCGNTVMSHIFAGVSPASIGVAPFTPTEYFGKSYSAEMLGFQTVQPEEIYIAPCLSGYIGGDITADLLAIDGALREQPSAKDVLQRGPMLLMDIGTNSELALSTPEEIYCTSAPAGPAFEGAEISCGMGALPGAICRVQIGKDGKGQDYLAIHTIEDVKARGICGVGLLELVHLLVQNGIVDETGRLRDQAGSGSFWQNHFYDRKDPVTGEKETVFYVTKDVVLTQTDLRKVQTAKAAIATGVELLLQKAGWEAKDLSAILLAGAFGNAMSVEAARGIGLLPQKFAGEMIFMGDAVLTGAQMLLAEDSRQKAQSILERCRVVEMTAEPKFEENFLRNMEFAKKSI